MKLSNTVIVVEWSLTVGFESGMAELAASVIGIVIFASGWLRSLPAVV